MNSLGGGLRGFRGLGRLYGFRVLGVSGLGVLGFGFWVCRAPIGLYRAL